RLALERFLNGLFGDAKPAMSTNYFAGEGPGRKRLAGGSDWQSQSLFTCRSGFCLLGGSHADPAAARVADGAVRGAHL
ncbi:hypothetical protein Q6253_31730, partial [Klebsiella quasipneumoniae]|nr:hypothetical protein [Klebsiella quasipneumoniae]